MNETPSSTLPRAVISRAALTAASAAAVAAGGEIADLRADAWGHGLIAVAQAVTAAGARAVLVDSTAERDVLRVEGVEATVDDDADIDSTLLYGLPDASGRCPVRPVLRLCGRVLSTKPLRAGEAVSYGYTHRADRDTRVALVTGGYAQGVVRALGNRAEVEIAGRRRPIVGRVAMDACVVDLGGEDVAEGAEVTFFGGTGPVRNALAEWASITGLSAGELVSVAGQHAVREWER